MCIRDSLRIEGDGVDIVVRNFVGGISLFDILFVEMFYYEVRIIVFQIVEHVWEETVV